MEHMEVNALSDKNITNNALERAVVELYRLSILADGSRLNRDTPVDFSYINAYFKQALQHLPK